MKALLNSGNWIEIDTSCLFNNQYNTVDGKRIFDKDISKIVDDVRDGLGKCKYCGAMVKRGEEENHFREKENKSCEGCFWWRDKIVGRATVRKQKERVQDENGEFLEYNTVTTETRYQKICEYAEKHGGCTNTECRRMGIEWFTPANTFFLRYPNGFASIPEVDKLKTRGFVLDDHTINAEYFKKLGSYTLVAVLSYTDGKATGISHYRIWNTRRDYNFRYEDGALYCDKYSFGWRKTNTLNGIPATVMDAIKKICGESSC